MVKWMQHNKCVTHCRIVIQVCLLSGLSFSRDIRETRLRTCKHRINLQNNVSTSCDGDTMFSSPQWTPPPPPPPPPYILFAAPLIKDNNFVGTAIQRSSSAACSGWKNVGLEPSVFAAWHNEISRCVFPLQPQRSRALSLLMEKQLRCVQAVTTRVPLQVEFRGRAAARGSSSHRSRSGKCVTT